MSMKKIKIIVQIIILILICVGLFFYFTHQNKKTSSVLPEVHKIEFKPKENLDPTIRERYWKYFIHNKKAIEKNPNDVNLWLNLGTIMKVIGNLDQAEEVWLYITKKWPDDPTAYGNLADLYTNFKKDYNKAEKYWKKAIEKCKNINCALIYYRNLYEFYVYHLKDKNKAKQILKQALEKYPNEEDFINLMNQL